MKNSGLLQLSIILLVSLTSISCKKEDQKEMPVNPPAAQAPTPSNKTFSYFSLGDSYTIGQSVDSSQRWSVQLNAQLKANGITVQALDMIAQTGWTTANLIDAINKSGNTKTYSMVSLLIGVNNQYQHLSMDQFRIEFRALAQTAIKYAGNNPKNVFVLSIPDWGVTPAARNADRPTIASEIDAFNAIVVDESNKAGIAFVDITPVSRTALNRPEFIANDSLHFSGKMYAKWATLALPVATQILQSQ
jgi:lysophospholipase L1-like esterase